MGKFLDTSDKLKLNQKEMSPIYIFITNNDFETAIKSLLNKDNSRT
jgi:hypothetical protein